MSHIGKLFNKAVNSPYVENNKVGKYSITPQHGANDLFIYNIYKEFETSRTINQFIMTVGILNKKIFVNLGKVYYTTYKRDYQNLVKEIELLYPDFKIEVVQ